MPLPLRPGGHSRRFAPYAGGSFNSPILPSLPSSQTSPSPSPNVHRQLNPPVTQRSPLSQSSQASQFQLTLSQLSLPYIPSPLSQQSQASQPRESSQPSRDVSNAVGFLVAEIDGQIIRAVIEVDRVLLVGRSPRCDVRIESPYISNVHLKFTPVRTNTTYTTVTVINMSTNAFNLNNVLMDPKLDAKVGEKRLRTKAYILKEFDQVRFQDCPVVFTFYQGPAHRRPVEDQEEKAGWIPLFDNESPFSTHLLGHWTVNNILLGSGTFGTVHLASHRQAAWLQVACKTVKKDTARESIAEAKILMGLSHPGVNTILDVIDEEHTAEGAKVGRLHLILELMAGGDLFAYHEKHNKLSEIEVKWIAFQLARGLKYIHEKKVAHRDIKSENILVATSTAFPRVVIGDFGSAITYQDVFETVPASDSDPGRRDLPIVGTMGYIPPERLKLWSRPPRTQRGTIEDVPRRKNPDGIGYISRRQVVAEAWFAEEQKIDSWSLGVVLYILTAGTHPYDYGDTNMGQLPETLAMVPSSGRGMTAASTSWGTWRGTVGESHRMGTSAPRFRNSAEADQARTLYNECKEVPEWWFASESWRDWSDEGINMMMRLIQPRPAQRIDMAIADQHTWFTSDKAALDALYEAIVHRGTVFNPASVNEVLEEKGARGFDFQGRKGMKPEPLFLAGASQYTEIDEDLLEEYI